VPPKYPYPEYIAFCTVAFGVGEFVGSLIYGKLVN
jgi:predicted MFS family arabinose efflux permease